MGTLPTDAYTPWIHRVGAWIIDSIPIFIVEGIAYGIAMATTTTSCNDFNTGYGTTTVCSGGGYSGLGLTLIFLAGLASLVWALWNWGYRQGTTGSSVGKSVLKFKVVSEATGQPIGFGMSVVRQIAHIVDGIICYIGYLLPLFTSKRQTIADMMLSTVCLPLEPFGSAGV